MRRIFLHSDTKCELGCKYCFADWGNVEESLLPKINANDNVYIIYPTCDADFNINWELCNKIINQYNGNKLLVFSFSSKNNLTDRQIEDILELNNKIDKGFVKLSVGFTTKSSIKEFEPNASSYDERIDTLKKLKEVGIETSVVLKPILPFIHEREYYEIIDDTRFVNRYLLGGLYVNSKTSFYQKYINQKYIQEKRSVEWNNGVLWDYIEDKNKMDNIHKYIMEQNGKAFYSDDMLIKEITNEKNIEKDVFDAHY